MAKCKKRQPRTATEELQELYEREQMFAAFTQSSSVKQVVNTHRKVRPFFVRVCERLLKDLFGIRMKYSKSRWSGPLFRLHQARVKDDIGTVRKLFKNSLRVCAQAGVTSPSVADLSETDIVTNAYERISDLIGGRVCVAYEADIDHAVETAKAELTLRGYEIECGIQDQDFRKDPNVGYSAVHFHVSVSIPFSGGTQDVLIELQARSLLNHAWCEMSHDIIYKPLIKRWGGVPDTIQRDSDDMGRELQICDSRFATLRERVARTIFKNQDGGW